MTLTDNQEQLLVEMLDTIGANRSRLGSWERTFFDDQAKRYAEHQSRMWLSGKQWAVLRKMYEKVTE